MASEWIDPRYAEMIAEWKRQQVEPQREGRPVRGFVVPTPQR